MNYEKIGQEYLDKYNITLDVDSSCWKRPHAHPKERRICKMPLPRGRKSLFDFLHEVGHIVDPRASRGLRAQEEHYATAWAVAEMRLLGIPVSLDQLARYRAYIEMSLARAKRRGLKKIPGDVSRYNDTSYKPHRHKYTIAGNRGHLCECGAWTSQ